MACPSCGASNEDDSGSCFSCGKDLFALTKGALLNERYDILQPLGRGGMGMVYKAHDRVLEETVAIKLLRADVAQSDDAMRRFRNEIRLARNIRHKNVCGIHEYGQQGHLRYIVMEYVEGTDFRQIVKRQGSLSAQEACAVTIEIASGLQAIHDAGVVHRDLKTPNIMRDAKGTVRLMDFGIAKRMDATTGTATGLVVGTPEYMSPEQARAERVDARSDLYALGIVLFELLTGHVPFRGDTPLATLMKHLSEAPTFDDPRIPPALVGVLQRALVKDREQRFAAASDMADAVRRAIPSLAASPVRHATKSSVVPVRQALEAPMATPAPFTTPTEVPTSRPTKGTAVPTAVTTAVAARGRRFGRGALLSAGLSTIAFGIAGYLIITRPHRESAAPTLEAQVVSPSPAASVPSAAPTAAPTATAASAATPRVSLPVVAPRPLRAAAVVAGTASPPPRVVTPTREATSVPPPVAMPPVSPTDAPVAPTPAAARAAATLILQVEPLADIAIDGHDHRKIGRITLPAGTHQVVFNHPRYEPLKRVVTLDAGETKTLKVDLRDEAVERKR